MEFGKSFTYVFEDDDWITKILLAAVIAFIPIIGPLAVAGWGVEITKRAIQKDPEQQLRDMARIIFSGLEQFSPEMAASRLATMSPMPPSSFR